MQWELHKLLGVGTLCQLYELYKLNLTCWTAECGETATLNNFY